MTDIPEDQIAPKPAKKKVVKKRKAAKRAPRAADPRPQVVAPPAETYPGLTKADCAAGCGRDGCTITGSKFCGHPAKGGLSFVDKHDPAALDRFAAAQKQLGLAAIER